MDNLLKNIYTSNGKFQVLFMMQLDQSTMLVFENWWLSRIFIPKCQVLLFDWWNL